jgi:hypothetical protein
MEDEVHVDRRKWLIDRIQKFEGGSKSAYAREELRAAIDQLIAIDSLEAQSRLARSQESLAFAQQAAADAQIAETARRESSRSMTEEQAFWTRRFLTSVTVALGAGAFATVTALLRTPPPNATSVQVYWALMFFLGGTAFMGLAPMIMAAFTAGLSDTGQTRHPKFYFWLQAGIAAVGAGLLVGGVACVVTIAQQTFQASRLTIPPAVSTSSKTPVTQRPPAPS